MLDKTSEIKLPNGMEIFCLSQSEALLVYREINEYIKHGITLNEGNIIFDVGANIGLFSLRAYQKCNKNLNIYAFEPIPEVFNVLKANAQKFDAEKIKVFPYGLSNESKSIEFMYSPRATALSTSYKEDLQELFNELAQCYIYNAKEAKSPLRILKFFPLYLRRLIVPLILKILAKYLQFKKITCTLKTISEIVRENQIKQIDLLKIDVEKAELDVLLGIEPQDWQNIKQIVIEVHDFDRRLQKIMTLLKQQGFNKIKLKQEPFFKNSNIYMLYAWQE